MVSFLALFCVFNSVFSIQFCVLKKRNFLLVEFTWLHVPLLFYDDDDDMAHIL
jgi:hypothetical protein